VTAPRYPAQDLLRFARVLLEHAGLDTEKANAVADILIEGDLLGHDTHGLHLLPPYLRELESGSMVRSGQPRVLHDKPAALTWDARRLPGPWVVLKAIEAAIPRAHELGTCSVAISRCHHIACLAAYLKRVTDQGLAILLTSSDPENTAVAPHGGRRGVMTPNPLAAGWPTGGDPVMIDVSSSYTTNGMTQRLQKEGRKFEHDWLLDAEGNPSNDPAVMSGQSKGSLLPLGGIEAGHKGFALGLLVEMLTSGLAGHGRADPQVGWSANVFLEIFDPAAFGGTRDFVRQTAWLAAKVRATPPRPGVEQVRMPGERGLKRRAEQLAQGVTLYPGILEAIAPWADKFAVPLPSRAE
jgi:L-lactate dehydrogenase